MKDDTEELKFLRADRLRASLEGLGRHLAVTSGSYAHPSCGSLRDLAWNHMDQAHRPNIHRTYTEALRIASGKRFAVSLTQVPFAGLKIFVLMTDIQIAPGRFYQTFTIFGLIYVHVFIEAVENQAKIDWHIVSHRLLRPLHGLLNRRMLRLNRVQNEEDATIQTRRHELRKKGFRFKSDDPDFLNSNTLAHGVIYPEFSGERRLELPGAISEGTPTLLTADPIELLIRKKPGGGFWVWSGVCPHEGASLAEAKCEGQELVCPWHSLRFSGVEIGPSQPRASLAGLELRLEGSSIYVTRVSPRS